MYGMAADIRILGMFIVWCARFANHCYRCVCVCVCVCVLGRVIVSHHENIPI